MASKKGSATTLSQPTLVAAEPKPKPLRWQCRSCMEDPVEPFVTMCGHLFCRRYASLCPKSVSLLLICLTVVVYCERSLQTCNVQRARLSCLSVSTSIEVGILVFQLVGRSLCCSSYSVRSHRCFPAPLVVGGRTLDTRLIGHMSVLFSFVFAVATLQLAS